MKQVIFSLIETECQDQQFDVNHLMMTLGLSNTYLRELTYKCYGQSPRELIESIRLLRVLTYIDRDIALEVISLKCGFGNYKTFRSAFKKRVGISAAKAREELHKSENKELLAERWKNQIWLGEVLTQ